MISDTFRSRQARLGMAFLLIVLGFALAGPWLAPHAPEAMAGTPYGAPGKGAWLGQDYLGRDVWSRLLSGGFSTVWMSIAATLSALVIGTVIGMASAQARGRVDQAIVWLTDVVQAFPDLILVLLVVSMLGRAPGLIVATVTVAFVPGVIRLARGVALGIAGQDYVEAARMMGYSRRHILLREILPNIATPLLVQFGVMLTWAVAVLSGLSFLGYGVAPPAADWGLMIDENRPGLVIQPWAVIAPVALIALFALGTNLLAEAAARAGAGIQERPA